MTSETPFCPSAQPDMPESVVFGVVGGTASDPRLRYLAEPLPTTAELLSLAEPAEPTEVFRFGAPCAQRQCQHFDGTHCRLGAKLATEARPVVAIAPPCRLRSRCRWWLEQGVEACLRCPMVVTTTHNPSTEVRSAALPGEPVPAEELDAG
jgi:hypothetical protein